MIDFIIKVINSCLTLEQLDNCKDWIDKMCLSSIDKYELYFIISEKELSITNGD